ncbi:nuclear transport factor 2 family protein [Amycolatopsis japonica]|uniref:nuclear transport factor 2 family protein n=1 Tax=Amycolatopsis japonica TaxID=208439 RepID=UPI00366FC32F
MTTLTTQSVEERLRYLLDRAEIQDLVTRYGLGQDLHQDGDNAVLEQWDQVFAPDATVDYSAAGASLAGIGHRELADAMRGPNGSMNGLRRWQHFEGVSTVDIQGDTATARTPHIHTHQGETEGRGWNLIQTGFFVDHLERRPEGWRIAHRLLEITWMDTFPVAS